MFTLPVNTERRIGNAILKGVSLELVFRKRITEVIAAVIAALAVSVTAFAEGDLGSSTLATGMSNLLNDASTVLLGLAAVVGTVCIIYFCIRRSAADEMDQKKWNNRIVTAVVSTIGAVIATSLLSVITGYFGGT